MSGLPSSSKVVIIGGGIVGCSTAYHLAKMGVETVLLERKKLTSGTTNSNGDYQRDYLLTLELINISTDESHKVSAKVRKGYHKSVLGRLKNYGD